MRRLAGTAWKLVETSFSDDRGNQIPPPLGPTPIGVVMFENERLIVAVSDGRQSLPPDDPPRQLICYSGRYRFQGTEIITTADCASRPDLLGRQVRHIYFDSLTRMTINTLLGSAGLKLVWERVG